MNNNESNDSSQADESAKPEDIGSERPAQSLPSTTAADSSTVGYQSAGQPQFKDRKTGLIVYGILQIIMGFFCAILIPLMLLPRFVGPAAGPPMNVQTLIPTMGMYALLAVLLVCLGVGSIFARRWARTLTLVLAWMWLAVGSTALLMLVLLRLIPFDFAAQGQQIPPQMVMIIQVVMLGTMGFIYFFLPGIFILFYRSKHVKATCDFQDPHVRWTDQCPLPVLAMSLMLGFGAISMIFSMSYGFVLPFFGILLKGVPCGLLVLTMTLLLAYLAWATYRLKIAAWWTTLIFYITFGVSSIITFSRIGLMEYYRELNFPEEQLRVMKQTGIIDRMNMPLMFGVSFVVFVGYLLWVRRYFVAGSVPNVDP